MTWWELFNVTDGRPFGLLPRWLARLIARRYGERYGLDYARPGEGWEDGETRCIHGAVMRVGVLFGGDRFDTLEERGRSLTRSTVTRFASYGSKAWPGR